MHLYIKNMVCNRCIIVVKQELEKLGIDNCQVGLGEVKTETELTKEKIAELEKNLSSLGFELLDNSRNKLIEKIKNLIIQQVHNMDGELTQNNSQILAH